MLPARARPGLGRAARAVAGAPRREGYDVIYPRYESPPPDPNARNNIVGAVRPRARRRSDARTCRSSSLGHSRGGRLAVEAAAFLKPRLVIALYPGQINPQFEPATNFKLIPKTTNIYLLVGDRDKSVGNTGALELDRRLSPSASPRRASTAASIQSTTGFTADHMSVYSLSEAGRARVWGRIDRLIARRSEARAEELLELHGRAHVALDLQLARHVRRGRVLLAGDDLGELVGRRRDRGVRAVVGTSVADVERRRPARRRATGPRPRCRRGTSSSCLRASTRRRAPGGCRRIPWLPPIAPLLGFTACCGRKP